jgi:tetratricopeptide (TPR) repeat protein
MTDYEPVAAEPLAPPTHPASPAPRHASFWPAALIVAAAVAVYANSFSVPFVFDDLVHISHNPALRHPWTAPQRGANWAAGSRPVGLWTFALDYSLHGDAVGGYHAVNLAIHAAAALLLFGLVRRTLGGARLGPRWAGLADPIALATALLWAVHPLQTQAVTYISQRLESLMGLCYLGTVYCFVRAVDGGPPAVGSRQSPLASDCPLPAACCRLSWYAASAAIYLVGLLTKEVIATAPLVILWYDRALVAAGWREIWTRRRWYYLTLLALVCLPLWGLYLDREHVARSGLLGGAGVSPVRYAASQPAVILHYLRLCFWPAGQCLDYGWPVAQSWGQIVPPALLLAVPLGLTVWGAVRGKRWALLGGWFFLVLAPTSSFLPIKDLAMEHRMYLPSAAVAAGTVLAAAAAARRLLRFQPQWQFPLAVACALAAGGATIALGVAAFRRNQAYQNVTALWEDTLAKAPENPRAQLNVAILRAREGRTADSLAHGRRAVALAPGSADAHYCLGSLLAIDNRVDEAVAQYRAALAIDPRAVQAHNDLGVLLEKQGNTSEALTHYRAALKIVPDKVDVLNNLANVLVQRGQLEEAVTQLRRAVELDPSFAPAHYNLGATLERQRKRGEAAAEYRRALELDPQHPEAHYRLANTLIALGEVDEAIAHYEQALALDPQCAEAHNNLGVALEQRHQVDQALAHYRQAVKINPRYVEAHGNLAVVHGARGERDEAILHFEQALAINPRSAQCHAGLAALLLSKGNLDAAIAHCGEAIKLDSSLLRARYCLGQAYYLQGKGYEALAQWRETIRQAPDALPVLNRLAWELATCPTASLRNGKEALELARRAISLEGESSPELLDTLAAAYAETGQFDAAAGTASRALELAAAAGKAELSRDLQGRLNLYRRGVPFRNARSPLASKASG